MIIFFKKPSKNLFWRVFSINLHPDRYAERQRFAYDGREALYHINRCFPSGVSHRTININASSALFWRP